MLIAHYAVRVWQTAALVAALMVAAVVPGKALAAPAIAIKLGVKIPLRDGVSLNATVYRQQGRAAPAPCIFTLTPYVSDTYHDRGRYFAEHGLPFAIVDVRGRGNSGGSFTPNLQEVEDGPQVVAWLARQPWCNGKVAMWGGSYAGYDQWATAKSHPAALATIVPAAAAHPGIDFPYRNNIGSQYLLQWLTFTAGRTSQANLFGDTKFWSDLWRQRFEKGEPFANLEFALGGEQAVLREWLRHPSVDAYFDGFTPTPAEYRAIDIPILTITGSYDDDQPGALQYYRNHMRDGSASAIARHFLIIGPWDHAGTRTPRDAVGSVKFGPNSLVDLPALHVAWYNWTMTGGDKPAFLKARVAYYVMGADTWRYADSLDAVTAESRPYFLGSKANADRLAAPGALDDGVSRQAGQDHYLYDPRDVSTAAVEAGIEVSDPTDTRMVAAQDGKQLVYETPAFDRDTELSGFFKLSAWIGIDQPDTDFQVSVYEIAADNRSILLTTDVKRARYRGGLRQAALVTAPKPLRYDFDSFTFTSRLVGKGSRLRMILGPINSIYTQKNYNSGKPVSDETMADARQVNVVLWHDRDHPSALIVPFGKKIL